MKVLILLTTFLILYSQSGVLGCPRSNFPNRPLLQEPFVFRKEGRAGVTIEPIVPYYYSIDLTIGSLNEKKVSGKVEMKFQCNQETKSIILNAYDMMPITLDSVSLKLDNGNDLSSNIKKVLVRTSSIVITLSQSIKAGKKYTLFIPYEPLPSKLDSFYNKYVDGGVSRYFVLLPNGEQSAADTFPCLAKNTLPAVFQVNITRPTEMQSISNMEISETIKLKDINLAKDIYKASPIMTTVSLTFIVHTMSMESLSTARGLKIRVFSPVDEAEKTKIPLKYLTKCIERIEFFFKSDLPISKIDAFPIPGLNAAALSSLGNILFLDKELLLSSETSPDRLKFASDTFCHELTHQYFGGLVFSDDKENGMLTEAFANYMGNHIMSLIEPSFNMEQYFLLTEMQPALLEDASDLSHPLTVPLPFPNKDRDYVDQDIGYNKGASFLRMLNDTMGQDNFQSGVIKFLETFLHKPYRASDMWTSLSQFTEGPLAINNINFLELCNTWTLQTGYPVLTVERNYESNTITLSQFRYIDNLGTEHLPKEKYTILGTGLGQVRQLVDELTGLRLMQIGNIENLLEQSIDKRKWIIPAEMTGLNQKYGFKFLTTATQIIDDVTVKPEDFLIVNEQRKGFYRVKYDERNWQLITEQLQISPADIQVLQRAALFDDAFKLAEYCYLNIKTALDLSKYLNDEDQYTPLKNALDNIKKIYTRYIYNNKVSRENMQKYVLSKLKPLYKKFDWKEMAFDNPEKNTRKIVFEIVCLMNDADCVQKSKEIYEGYLENNPSDDSLENIAKCTAIRNDDRSWDILFETYQEKRRFNSFVLNGLSCSEDPDNIKRYIDYTLSKTFDGRGRVAFLKEISANPAATTTLWSILNPKYNGLLNNEENPDILKALAVLVQNVDSLDVAKVNSFTNYQKTFKSEIFKKKALNVISGNAHWKKCNQDAANQWLSDNANLIPNEDSSNINLEDEVVRRTEVLSDQK